MQPNNSCEILKKYCKLYMYILIFIVNFTNIVIDDVIQSTSKNVLIMGQ